MAVDYEIKIYHPSGSPSRVVVPQSVDFGGGLNEAAGCSLNFISDFDLFEDESSSTNPCQVKSWISVKRNGFREFCGRITRRELDMPSRTVKVEAADAWAEIGKCIASFGGDALGVLATSTSTVAEATMVPAFAGSTRYYPAPATANAWRAITGTPKTVNTAGTATWATGTKITATASHERMLNTGFLITPTSKCVHYDGYDLATGGAVYEFKQVSWDALGTTGSAPADNLASSAVYQYLPNRIDPSADMAGGKPVLAWDGATPLNYGSDFTVDFDDGCIILAVAPGGAVTASYLAYDEDDAPAAGDYILGGDNTYGVIEILLSATRDNLGPGLTPASHLDIDIPRVVIPRLELDGQLLGEIIPRLLAEQGQNGVTYEAADPWGHGRLPLAYWLDPNAGTGAGDAAAFKVQAIEQHATGTWLPNVASLGYEITLAGVKSGVLTKWTEDGVAHSAMVRIEESYFDAAGSKNLIWEQAACAKFVGDTGSGSRWPSMPRVGIRDERELSEGAALTLAREDVLKSLSLAQARAYRLAALPTRLPRLGLTYRLPDGFKGVCIARRYGKLPGQPEGLHLTLLDMSTPGRLA